MSEERTGSGSSSLGATFDGVKNSFDVYETINAPQFVDFEDLKQYDDEAEGDQFFSTHREEDDYFVPVENLVPSIQFLNFSEANDEENENKKYTEVISTAVLKNNSQLQNPTTTTSAIPIGKVKVGYHIPIFNSCEYEDNENNGEKENTIPNSGLFNKVNKTIQENEQNSPNESCLRESLVAQLENFCLNLSDETCKEDEEASVLLLNSMQPHPQLQSINISGVVTQEDSIHDILTPTSTAEKATGLGLGELENLGNNEVIERDILIPDSVADKSAELGQEKLENHDTNEVIEVEIVMNNSKKLSPVVTYKRPDERPYSMIVESAVGSEVKWIEDKCVSMEKRPEDIAEPEDCFFDFESHILSGQVLHDSPHNKQNARRVSSCSDLTNLIVQHNVFGYMPHVGITVPKTPDKAPKLAESRIGWSNQKMVKKSEEPFKRQSRTPVRQNNYVPLAEAVNQFHRNVPDRFHSVSKTYVPARTVSASGDRRDGNTGRRVPSPSPVRFSYRAGRKNSESANSSFDSLSSNNQQKLDLKSEKMVQGMIKPTVLSLPKKIEIKTTVPKPFKFHETHRRQKIDAPEQEEFVFKARPAPLKIFHGPTGIKDKIEIKPTSAKELHFASDDRIRDRQQRKAIAVTETSPVRTKSRPLTASRIPTPCKGQLAVAPFDAHKKTTVCPFSFEDRNQEALRRKQEKIKQESEVVLKIPVFHANPLPNFSKSGLPKRKQIELTDIVPFNLRVDERGATYQQNWKQKLDSELKDFKEQTNFYANPPSVIYKKPFEPDYYDKPLVEPIEFQLHSDKRAQEREKFEHALREKQEQEEEQRHQMEIEQEGKDKEETTEKRKGLVHRALPLKMTRAFHVKSSDKPLTEPKSPAFKPLPSQRRILK